MFDEAGFNIKQCPATSVVGQVLCQVTVRVHRWLMPKLQQFPAQTLDHEKTLIRKRVSLVHDRNSPQFCRIYPLLLAGSEGCIVDGRWAQILRWLDGNYCFIAGAPVQTNAAVTRENCAFIKMPTVEMITMTPNEK